MSIDQLIDWPQLSAAALWITGMAALLFLVSLRSYLGYVTRTMTTSAWCATALVCSGFGMSNTWIWPRFAWLAAGVIILVMRARVILARLTYTSAEKKSPSVPTPPPPNPASPPQTSD